MQDQPTAAELVGAVRDFLNETAIPALEGRARFHALVAVNALAIVERELEIAPSDNADEKRRLVALLGAEETLDLGALNRMLCERIASGEVTLETPGLADHLKETTLTKLAIDQPKYSAYKRAIESAKD